MNTKLLITAGGAVLTVGFLAHGKPGPEPDIKATNTVAAFPDVKGMAADKAEIAIKQLLPNGSALTEFDRGSYDYAVANHCTWTGPDGKASTGGTWPVDSVTQIIHPEMAAGKSPTQPVQAGTSYDTRERLFFELHTEKPADVWCKPYNDDQPDGGLPHVNVPNHHDHGEPWFCRHHRWC